MGRFYIGIVRWILSLILIGACGAAPAAEPQTFFGRMARALFGTRSKPDRPGAGNDTNSRPVMWTTSVSQTRYAESPRPDFPAYPTRDAAASPYRQMPVSTPLQSSYSPGATLGKPQTLTRITYDPFAASSTAQAPGNPSVSVVNPPVTPGTDPSTPKAPTKPAPSEIPRAIPDGNGRVTMPFPPYQLLDVNGMASGSLAMDPTSGKMFRVP